jgi:hypothetical protein
VRKLASADGADLARCALGGDRRFGPVCSGHQVFVAIHEPKTPRGKAEIMRVLALDDLSLRWEYRDEKGFIGDPAVDGSGVYVTTSAGEVLRFK